ncbi:MAG: Cyanophycinase [Firmicutes bacterium]|nr:Cyanophycinase [Bacillota bacterium]
MGLGIDEDTAIEVTTSGRFTALGSGCVTVLDGRSLTHSTVSDTWADEPFALTDVTLHLLPGGYSFDLITRRPSLTIAFSSAETQPAPGAREFCSAIP